MAFPRFLGQNFDYFSDCIFFIYSAKISLAQVVFSCPIFIFVSAPGTPPPPKKKKCVCSALHVMRSRKHVLKRIGLGSRYEENLFQ